MKFAILILFTFILVSATCALNNLAYGSFDADGKYYCNSKNINLEIIIYTAAVNKLNTAIDDYLSLEPSPSNQELYNFIIHSSSGTVEPTYSIINKSSACLASNHVDPLSIAEPISFSKLAYAPEFGTLVNFVVLMSLVGVIVITRKEITR